MPYNHHEDNCAAMCAAIADESGTYHGGRSHPHGRIYYTRKGDAVRREIHSDAGRTLSSKVVGRIDPAKPHTHYLHHAFTRGETGAFVQVWRKIGVGSVDDGSAIEDGDLRTETKKPCPAFYGETKSF